MGAIIAYYGRGPNLPSVTLRVQQSDLVMSTPEKEPNPFQSPESPHGRANEEKGLSQHSLRATIAAAVVSILIVVGLFLVAPGVGVLAALVLVPANLRAILLLRREFQANGNWPAGWNQVSAFVVSALVMLPVWIATGIAFYAVCWAGAMIAVTAFPMSDDYGFTNMIIGGIPLGLIAGLISFILCFRLTLRSDSTQADIEGENSKRET